MQLRDIQTSSLVFEGTPYAVAKLYVGNEDKYILDGSFEGFDPADEIAQYEGLLALQEDLKGSRVKDVAAQREAVRHTLSSLDPSAEE